MMRMWQIQKGTRILRECNYAGKILSNNMKISASLLIIKKSFTDVREFYQTDLISGSACEAGIKKNESCEVREYSSQCLSVQHLGLTALSHPLHI